MASVNPNIALSARPFQLDLQQRNPLQEYAQISAIQNAQIQNQLARQQMEQEQGVMNYLRTANLNTPEGRAGLRGFGKAGFGYEKLLAEQDTNALQRRELEGKLRAQQMTALGTGLTSVLTDPSDANLNAAFDRLDATGVDTRPFRQQFANMPDLAARKTAITQYVTSNPEGRQALAFVQPKPEKMDLNGRIVVIDMNPNSATYQQEVKQLAKTTTPPAMVAEYTFAKTPEGGNFKGTYQEFVTARAAAGRAPQQPVAPTITTIEDPTAPGKFLQVDARTYRGGGAGSPGVIGGARPSAATEKATRQQAQLGKDLEFAIKELGNITKDGGLIDQSTGSGAGRLVDIGARFVGQAMPGDIAIGKIAPVADLALKLVPRFEGPQSDKDTASYKEAAGQLADPTLPTKVRKEAGKTVLRLMTERKNQFVTSDMAAEGTTGGGVDTNNPLLK